MGLVSSKWILLYLGERIQSYTCSFWKLGVAVTWRGSDYFLAAATTLVSVRGISNSTTDFGWSAAHSLCTWFPCIWVIVLTTSIVVSYVFMYFSQTFMHFFLCFQFMSKHIYVCFQMLIGLYDCTSNLMVWYFKIISILVVGLVMIWVGLGLRWFVIFQNYY